MYSCSHFSGFLSDDLVRKQSTMSKLGQKTTSNHGESDDHAWGRVSRGVRKNLFTKFGISGQSGEHRWKKRSRESIQETGAPRLKIRSRISPSESTRECSKSIQETGAGGSTPNTQWWGKTFLTPIAQGNFLRHHQNWETWNTWTINTRARSFSFCKRDLECQQTTQHSQCKHTKQMYWYGECSCLRRWKPPSILGRNFFNSEIYKNTKFEEIESLFNITHKLVMEHSEEILNVKCLESSSLMIKRSSGRRQKCVSVLIPFYVLDRWRTAQEQ